MLCVIVLDVANNPFMLSVIISYRYAECRGAPIAISLAYRHYICVAMRNTLAYYVIICTLLIKNNFNQGHQDKTLYKFLS